MATRSGYKIVEKIILIVNGYSVFPLIDIIHWLIVLLAIKNKTATEKNKTIVFWKKSSDNTKLQVKRLNLIGVCKIKYCLSTVEFFIKKSNIL